jgi:hypothetical protein
MLSDTYIFLTTTILIQKSETYITPIFLARHNISILFNDSWVYSPSINIKTYPYLGLDKV